MSTLLTIASEAADDVGIPRPSSVIGSANHDARAILRFANKTGKELARRHDWQRLTKEKTFSATATEEQSGALPSDFARFVTGSFWNRTQDRRVAGPLSAQRWQMLKSGLILLPYDAFRIRGNSFLMNPTPVVNDSMAFEYITKFWCGASADTTPTQETFSADTDIVFLDYDLFVLGVVWRFKKARGLDYGEDFRSYELAIGSLSGHDGGMADLDMGLGDDGSAVIDPYITDGNWSIN